MLDMAKYAVTEANSAGRDFPEKPHPYRSDFERDRDRIIHCSAFRRLEGKTQVFTPGVNDHFRTRLTHTIEVAQIGRTIANQLGVNEHLTEAICLGHDLGHSPFGHCGEMVLNELMADYGGFEHNSHTLRVVEILEHPYSDFAGLNLMYETLLGFARHHSKYDNPDPDHRPEPNCSIEGQIADVADRIAYNCHDLEDGMRTRWLFADAPLDSLEIYKMAHEAVDADSIGDGFVRSNRIVKSMFDFLVSDAIETSGKAISDSGIETLEEVVSHQENLVRISPRADMLLSGLEGFLLENMYKHPQVMKGSEKATKWLVDAFEKVVCKPEVMPGYFQGFIERWGVHRAACDYVAGMTDRFCQRFAEE